EDIRDRGLDALIVTGANPAQHLLERESFWEPLGEVLDWAKSSTRSVLCSCLATHAVVERYDGVTRTRLPDKRWGVYRHRVVADHPLLDGLEDPVVAPHSHWYDMTRRDFESIGASVLLESDEAGVHMAVGAEGHFVFFQGHPEYDRVSLLKEYRRELGRYYSGDRPDHPPVPEHYFDDAALTRLNAYRLVLEEAKSSGRLPPPLDENQLLPKNAPDWNSAGYVIYRNWLSSLLR
ncbi:MAG: homoserine O-succinyltransferase, partial [Acidimicrobiia bacterium]